MSSFGPLKESPSYENTVYDGIVKAPHTKHTCMIVTFNSIAAQI